MRAEGTEVILLLALAIMVISVGNSEEWATHSPPSHLLLSGPCTQ
uniref:Uncharacterized protein n=2 Tax=Anguilla anguilla TaxID=7936 RepID=A0A0E9R4Z7_ANGAN